MSSFQLRETFRDTDKKVHTLAPPPQKKKRKEKKRKKEKVRLLSVFNPSSSSEELALIHEFFLYRLRLIWDYQEMTFAGISH